MRSGAAGDKRSLASGCCEWTGTGPRSTHEIDCQRCARAAPARIRHAVSSNPVLVVGSCSAAATAAATRGGGQAVGTAAVEAALGDQTQAPPATRGDSVIRATPGARCACAGGVLTTFCRGREQPCEHSAAMHSKLAAMAAATALGVMLAPAAAFAPLQGTAKLAAPQYAASRLGAARRVHRANDARPALLSLRAQKADNSRLGWVGRPGSSMPPAEMQVSEIGKITVDGADICYDFLPGDGPTIFFLPALNQTRHGAKANALKTWCRRQGRSFLVADFFATGKSDGEYRDATISRWVSDTAKIIDHIVSKKGVEKVTLVSMLRCALRGQHAPISIMSDTFMKKSKNIGANLNENSIVLWALGARGSERGKLDDDPRSGVKSLLTLS